MRSGLFEGLTPSCPYSVMWPVKVNLTPDVSGFYYHFVPTSLCQNQYNNTQHNSVSKSSGSFGRHTSTHRRFASNSDAMSRVSASHDPSPPSEPALVTCLPYPFCEKQDLSHVPCPSLGSSISTVRSSESVVHGHDHQWYSAS